MDMDKRYLSVIKACALSLLLVGVGGLSSCNSDDRLQSCPSFIN